MADIAVSNVGTSHVTLYLTNLDGTWADGTRTVTWYLGYNTTPTLSYYQRTGTSYLANGALTGGHITFNLPPARYWGIYCTVFNGSTYLTQCWSEVTLVPVWSWSSSNGIASATATSAAYNAVVNKTATNNFSHVVWNDMVDKVKTLTDNITGYWDTDYATYYNTKFNSTPYELTATMFNSLRNNLELVGAEFGYSKTGIGVVSKGGEVKGDYFLTLAEYINKC